MREIESHIQRLKSELYDLEIEKCQTSSSDIDILIIDSQIHTIETQLEHEIRRYNNLLQLNEFQSCCEHLFVEDLIDISPEQSITVRYCDICLFTHKN
jgi:hypothetical protein